MERQVWPEAESAVAFWCRRRTEADEAVRAAVYVDGVVAAHADISLRLASECEQASENSSDITMTSQSKEKSF